MEASASQPKSHSFDFSFLHPRYWLTWVGLGILRLIILLPWSWQRSVAKVLGALIYILAKRRRLIAQTNIRMCFQSLNYGAQKRLLKQTLYENALGIIETGHAFWGKEEALQNITSFHGPEKLQAALKAGNGAILIGAHYTTLDLGGRLFAQFLPVDVLYRPHKNKLFDHIILKARRRWAGQVINNKSTRQIIRSIKQNHIFWYPADQDYGPENSMFVSFFGFPAATLSTTARLAKLTKAPVFVLGHHRKDDQFSYEIHVTEVEPQADDQALTQKVNELLEDEIRRYPAQYMWVHRRFKTRPSGFPYLYPS